MSEKFNPLISILVPIYNVENFIVECVTSLFEQTYDNIEYIFVDDCSPDDSVCLLKNVVKKYPLREPFVHIIRHEENRGLSIARNTAIKHSRGEYVLPVDSDDYIDIRTVEKCVEVMGSTKADVVVFGYKYIFSDKTQIVQNVIPDSVKQYVREIIQRKCVVCLCGGLYKRNLHVDFGIWGVEGLEMGEDYVTKPRLVYNAKKVVSINEPFYNYRQTNLKSCTNVFKEKNIKDLILAISVLNRFFQEQEDYSNYVDSLRIGAMSTKAILLIDWSLKSDDESIRNLIANLYEEYTSLAGLRMQEKIVLWLSNHKYFILLNLFVRIGYRIKYFLK